MGGTGWGLGKLLPSSASPVSPPLQNPETQPQSQELLSKGGKAVMLRGEEDRGWREQWAQHWETSAASCGVALPLF